MAAGAPHEAAPGDITSRSAAAPPARAFRRNLNTLTMVSDSRDPRSLEAALAVTMILARGPARAHQVSFVTAMGFHPKGHLACERIRAKLEVQDLAGRSFSAFCVKRCAGSVGSPESPSLPPGLWVVNPAIQA